MTLTEAVEAEKSLDAPTLTLCCKNKRSVGALTFYSFHLIVALKVGQRFPNEEIYNTNMNSI